MKKLMLGIAAVALAATVQASSFNWSFSAGTDYNGYSVYLTTSAGAFVDLAAIEAALVGTGGDQSGTLAKASPSARNVTATSFVTGSWADGENVDFYYVIVKDSDYWVTDKQSIAAVVTGTPNKNTISQATGTNLLKGTPTGSFSAAPEPTSAMLMLLGVAGLALRRRRA